MLGFQNAKGTVIIENGYIAQLASLAASECFGVVGLSVGSYIEFADMLFGNGQKRGVEVSTKDGVIFVKLYIAVSYGVNISVIVKSIVNRVRYAIEKKTGFPVGAVDVYVQNIC